MRNFSLKNLLDSCKILGCLGLMIFALNAESQIKQSGTNSNEWKVNADLGNTGSKISLLSSLRNSWDITHDNKGTFHLRFGSSPKFAITRHANNIRLGLNTHVPRSDLQVHNKSKASEIRMTNKSTLNGARFFYGLDKKLQVINNDGHMSFKAGNAQMFLRSTGDVGIGTENPSRKLDVRGDVIANSIYLRNNSGANKNSSIYMQVDKGKFHAFRASEGNENIGTMHFFSPSWKGGAFSQSAGAMNLQSSRGITFGVWNNPIMAIDNKKKAVVIGSTQAVDGAVLHVDGRTYISEDDGNEAGWDNRADSRYKDYLLWVEEGIVSKDFAIAGPEDWPDYVFDESYNLKSLEEVENHIKTNGYLPTMPSAEEVEQNGFTVENMTKRTVQTIEELTLHTIAQEKAIAAQKSMINQLLDRLEKLENNLQR